MPIFDNIAGAWRQVAKSYSNINGVWREDSKVYDNVVGVWREAFSAGIQAKYDSGNTYQYRSSDGTYIGEGYFKNNSLPEVLSIIGSAQSGKYSTKCSTLINIALPDLTQYPKNTPLVRVDGLVTVGGTSLTITGVTIMSIYTYADATNPQWFSYKTLLSGDLYNPVPNGAHAVDTTLLMGDIIKAVKKCEIQIEVDYLVGGDKSGSASLSIPWSAFTWLPTGEPLVYQP